MARKTDNKETETRLAELDKLMLGKDKMKRLFKAIDKNEKHLRDLIGFEER